MDSLACAISPAERYHQPAAIKRNIFGVRDLLLDQVRTRFGEWDNAWVIGTYPYKAERERLLQRLNAQEIYIRATREECIQRAVAERPNEWLEYVNNWFDLTGL